MDDDIPFTSDADGLYHLTQEDLLQWKVKVMGGVADLAASFSESMVVGLNQSANALEQESDSDFKRGIIAGIRIAANQIYKAAAELRKQSDPPSDESGSS